MHCPSCGSKMRSKVLAERDLGATLGLPSLVARHVPAFVCDRCDDVLLPGRVLESVSTAALRALLVHNFPLVSAELRFMRKAVGLTQADLGARLGVDRVSIARWETQDRELPGPESIAVRAVIAAAEGSPVRGQPVEMLRRAPAEHPRRLEVELHPAA